LNKNINIPAGTTQKTEVSVMNRHSLILCTIVNILLLIVNPTLADTTSTEAYLKLTEEMRNIIDHNQENFDSVRLIHGTIKIISTISYKDKGSRVKEQTEEIWYDGSHFRADILESRFIGKETAPLLLEEDNMGGRTTLEPEPVGCVKIDSFESRMSYRPGTVHIYPPENDAGKVLRSTNLMHYQTIMGRTLKELILRSAAFTVKNETVNGDDCLLLEYYNAKYEIARKIWIVPSKGCCIKKTQLLQKGIVHEEYTTTLKEYLPGIWWFDSVKVKTRRDSEGIFPDVRLELSVESVTLNEPIDPKTFTLAGTNIPPGTKVSDHISGLQYVYGAGYELAQEDVDLALDALKNSQDKPIKETVDIADEQSQEVPSKPKANTEHLIKNDSNLTRNAQAEKTGKGLLLSVGLGSVLALSIIGILLIKMNKKRGK